MKSKNFLIRLRTSDALFLIRAIEDYFVKNNSQLDEVTKIDIAKLHARIQNKVL